MATILVSELSAYESRTYGTRYGGSILAVTHLGVLKFSRTIIRRLYVQVI